MASIFEAAIVPAGTAASVKLNVATGTSSRATRVLADGAAEAHFRFRAVKSDVYLMFGPDSTVTASLTSFSEHIPAGGHVDLKVNADSAFVADISEDANGRFTFRRANV